MLRLIKNKIRALCINKTVAKLTNQSTVYIVNPINSRKILPQINHRCMFNAAWHLANTPSVDKIAKGYALMDGKLVAHFIVHDIEEGWIDVTAPMYWYDDVRAFYVTEVFKSNTVMNTDNCCKHLKELKIGYRKLLPWGLRWIAPNPNK